MAALSSYSSNYGQLDFSTIFKEDNPFEFSSQTLLDDETNNHFNNYDNVFFDLVDPTDYFLPQENYTQVAQNPLFDESLITLEDDDYELSNMFLKRQKCYYEDDNNNNALMGDYYYMQPQVVVPPPPSIFTPPQYFQESFSSLSSDNMSTTKGYCNGKERGSSVTAQSIAARARRKKISEKTVELSKLIPGGSNKMNSTAEMLHAAFNYVKFMQAQVAILQSMSSLKVHGSNDSEAKEEDVIGHGNLEELELVTSGKIQDKLASMGMCLVPTEFVKELAKDASFPSISDTILNQLLVLD